MGMPWELSLDLGPDLGPSSSQFHHSLLSLPARVSFSLSPVISPRITTGLYISLNEYLMTACLSHWTTSSRKADTMSFISHDLIPRAQLGDWFIINICCMKEKGKERKKERKRTKENNEGRKGGRNKGMQGWKEERKK